jgi:hypothetical protein
MATDAERKAAAKAAFDKRQARIRKDKGVTVAQRNTQKEDTIARAKILAQLGLSVLPAGAVIRGGMLIYRGLKGAKALSALRKAEQAKKVSKASTPSKAASKPSTPPRAPGLATNRKPVSLAKKTPKSNGLTAAQKLAIAGGVAATAGATKLSNTNAKPTATEAAKRKPTGMADRKTSKPALQVSKRTPTGMGDRKTSKPTVEASKRKPTGMGDRKTRKPVEKKRTTLTDKEIAAKMLTRKEREERPSPRSFSPDKAKEGAATKRTSISASKNTGFGPKGDIFPSNAADRKRLMAKFGGTGSAAAKAAARGTQGNLKKGKK